MAASRVMGTGTPQRLAMRWGNAHGAKVPTVGRPSKRKQGPYARREYAVSTNLERIGEKARNEPGLVFTSLYHHVSDVDNLRACYDALPKNRAVGVDGVTKEAYGQHLEANLQALSGRLKRREQPSPRRDGRPPAKTGCIRGTEIGWRAWVGRMSPYER